MRYFFFLFLFVSRSFAVTKYVAQSAAGANDGSSAANAYSIAQINAASPYSPAGDDIVILTANAVFTSQLIPPTSGSGITHQIHYVFATGAKFSSPAWPTGQGGIYINSKNYIEINGDLSNGRQGIMECTANGTLLANQNACAQIYCNNATGITIRNLTLNNTYVRPTGSSNDGMGAPIANYGTTSNYTDFTVDNCAMDQGYIGVDMDFGTGTSPSPANYSVTNCTFSHFNWGVNLGDRGSGSTLQGFIVSGCTFGNYSNWDHPSDNFHHNGVFIHPNNTAGGGFVRGVRIFKNTFNDGYGNNATGGVYANGSDYDSESIVYDNVFYANTDWPTNGLITVAIGKGTFYIFNNSFISSSGSGANAITVAGQFGGVNAKSYIVNNNVSVNCLLQYAHDMTGTGTTLAQDHNIAFGTTTSGAFYQWEGGTQSLAQWQARGFDTWIGNPNVDPKYVSTSNMHLQATSPCISAGVDESAYFTTDFDSVTWAGGSGWGVGAYKYLSAGSFASAVSGKASLSGKLSVK